jgi:hypothetical protein
LWDPVLTKKLASSVGAVYLKAICSAAVFRSETHIMEHRLTYRSSASNLRPFRLPVAAEK